MTTQIKWQKQVIQSYCITDRPAELCMKDNDFYATFIFGTVSWTFSAVLIKCLVASSLIGPPLNCLDLKKLLLRAVSAQRPIEKGAHVKMMFAR